MEKFLFLGTLPWKRKRERIEWKRQEDRKQGAGKEKGESDRSPAVVATDKGRSVFESKQAGVAK